MRLRRELRILYMLFKMKLQRTMAFRFSFFGVTIVDGSLFLVQLLMFSTIYSRIDTIGGWAKAEVLLSLALFHSLMRSI